MNEILFPIIGKINELQEKKFKRFIKSIGLNDNFISYISSPGGNANSASFFVQKIEKLPMKSIAFSGSIVYSSAAIIYSSFKERIAFFDSKFLIHPCIPPNGTERTEIFDQFDLQTWQFMIKRMKISLEELIKIAKKDERITAHQALEIGLVTNIEKGSYKDFLKSIKFK